MTGTIQDFLKTKLPNVNVVKLVEYPSGYVMTTKEKTLGASFFIAKGTGRMVPFNPSILPKEEIGKGKKIELEIQEEAIEPEETEIIEED